ncbi:nuclear transport factor 2 family protein, partial [Hahella sp. HN01]|uniref:nuclear transport factor 2 family protein n=1 Tax=Hahella sp. HN01 TaxID=2847262 RepID=UPI001C1ED14D
ITLVADQGNGLFFKLFCILFIRLFLTHADTLIVDGYCLLLMCPGLLDHYRYISVITVRDGMIERYVDYWNPLVALDALGNLAPLQGEVENKL